MPRHSTRGRSIGDLRSCLGGVGETHAQQLPLGGAGRPTPNTFSELRPSSSHFLTSARLDMKVWNWGRDSRALMSGFGLDLLGDLGAGVHRLAEQDDRPAQVIPGHAVAFRLTASFGSAPTWVTSRARTWAAS